MVVHLPGLFEEAEKNEKKGRSVSHRHALSCPLSVPTALWADCALGKGMAPSGSWGQEAGMTETTRQGVWARGPVRVDSRRADHTTAAPRP